MIRRVVIVGLLALTACLTRNPNRERGLRPTEGGRGTAPSMPPFEASDEATAQQLERTRDQGNVERAELEWVRAHEAVASGEMAVGEYRVAYVVTPALGWYAPRSHAPRADGGGAALEWHEGKGAQLGVVVRDAADGRTVPGLTVRATLVDSASGRVVDARPLPFGWYPVLNRYGDQLPLPGAGPFTLRLAIAPPAYRRHDPTNGDRFADSVVAEFDGVRVDAAALDRAGRWSGGAQADSARRALARLEGAALERPLVEMFSSVAVNGAQTRVGDYLVAVAVERAEGFWVPRGGDLAYDTRVEQSAETNAHVEVAVRDALTGRLLPGLAVRATLLDARGREVGTRDEPFMWHPWIHHYGENWRVPRSGRYTVRVHADPPPYRRYASAAGRGDAERFAAPIDVAIPDLRIVTGQK